MIVSKAARTGEFDHAIVTPNQEVYTPGSTISFRAVGVDLGGGQAQLPAGVKWSVVDGGALGSIDPDSGVFTSQSESCGTVTVALNNGGTEVGRASVELQWPDKLAFTNTSISLDFGESSDLTLKAYYNRMDVNIKDGDIAWSLDNASLGSFTGNTFTAADRTSQKGIITAKSVKNPGISASIDVVVGMEPYVLMDFEDRQDNSGNTINAKDYWSIHVGDSTYPGNGHGELTSEEIANNRLWLRSLSPVFTTHEVGKNDISLVNIDSGEPVRFGQNALRFDFDFTKFDKSRVADAVMGFSSDTLISAVQPTKIGMWVNVPAECNYDGLELKAIIKGKGKEHEQPGTSYAKWDQNYNVTYVPDHDLIGTTKYVSYHSFDPQTGEKTGSTLKDWAGKGWIWVECDISDAQMPIDLCRAYTIRIISAQNKPKVAGHIYIDNLQFIYGTNPNDIVNPVIDSIQGQIGETPMEEIMDGSTVFTNHTLNFSASFSDVPGKYASGIDTDTARIFVDGQNMTARASLKGATFYLPDVELTNGIHSVTVTVRDKYGNETSETRSFTISDAQGIENTVVVRAADGAVPTVGGIYPIVIESDRADLIQSMRVTVEIPSAYRNANRCVVRAGNGYEVSSSFNQQGIVINAVKKNTSAVDKTIAVVEFKIPDTCIKGDSFWYIVPQGAYTADGGKTYTFTQPKTEVDLNAAYDITVDSVVATLPSTFHVSDKSGKPVANAKIFCDGHVLGTTDETGTLNYTFPSGSHGRKTMYAATEAGRSWNIGIVVNEPSSEGSGKPIGIQNNGVKTPCSAQSITWLSSIDGSQRNAKVKLSVSPDMANAIDHDGTSVIRTFTDSAKGTAFRLNTVNLSGLTPETTYYYQAGDGTVWSEIHSFKTTAKDTKAETDFFVFGDVQTSDTSRLDAAINHIKASNIDYSFGIQTGDAIDNVTNYDQWRPYLTQMNGVNLNGINMVHTMGNHEYYGDTDGIMAGTMFDLPNHAQGGYYSVEYGNVYIGVMNHGGNLEKTLQTMKADAANTSCSWKILVMHEPIYGTNPSHEMSAETRKTLAKYIEDAGISFVFAGDDHAFARTKNLKQDAAVDDGDLTGVVYFVSGDLSSKGNDFTKDRPYFATAIPHVDYDGMYITGHATEKSFTIEAHKYNGDLLDSYTRSKTGCGVGEHTYDQNSCYNPESKAITCAVCQQEFPAAESHYTGKLAVKGQPDKFVMLADGKLQTGWFPVGNDMFHTGPEGILHKTVTRDTATCTKNGRIEAECLTCHDKYVGAGTWAKGHTWDENHKCTVCGELGIDIANAELKTEYLYYSYTGKAIRPRTTATYHGKQLVASSDRYGTDAYITYQSNQNIGVATVTYEGRGSFYGTKSVTFTIVPESVPVIKATSIGNNAVTLAWNAASGAQDYYVQRLMADGTWKTISNSKTSKTAYTVTGLDEMTEYQFRVLCSATIGGKVYYCLNYSKPLKVTTSENFENKTYTYLTDLACTDENWTSKVQVVDGQRYLFLPSTADLSKLSFTYQIADSASGQNVVLTGSKGTVTLGSSPVDLSALADLNQDRCYTIQVKLGEYQPFELYVMRSSGVSSMHITSDDPASKGRDFVDAIKGNKATGTMLMLNEQGNIVYNGRLSQIKARGNSTFRYYPKKPYQIKLTDKTDLLNTGESVGTWVLLANYVDATQMHDKLFKDLAAKLGMPYVAHCDWVDLFYDGEYRGTYLLTEKSHVGKDGINITNMEKAYENVNAAYGSAPEFGKVDLGSGSYYTYTKNLTEPDKLTGGYLLELNHDKPDEVSGFVTARNKGVNVKHPEWAGKDAMSYISSYYQEFEDAVFAIDANGKHTGINPTTGKRFDEYCDLTSLVQLFLLQELGINPDGFASSTYFYKDVDGIMYAGPIWDQDCTLGTGWANPIPPDCVSQHYINEELAKIPAFMDAVHSYMDRTFVPAMEGLTGPNGKIHSYEKQISDSAAMNFVLWLYVKVGDPQSNLHLWASGTTYQDVLIDMNNWLSKRSDIMMRLYKTPSSGGGSIGGGGSSSGGSAILPVKPENGTVTINPKNAKQGTPVTITVVPDKGFVVDRVTVVDAHGNAVAVTQENEKFIFTMPNGDVKVQVTFTSENTAVSSQFTDVPQSAWYFDAVQYAVEKGLMRGVSETLFAPDMDTSRAMIVTILYQLEKAPDIVTTSNFIDVPDNQWFSDAIHWAVSNGIVSGYGDGTFGPNDPITREQIATILFQYAQYKGYGKAASASLSQFVDADQISDWAVEAMTWANAHKLINGTSEMTILPAGKAARSQTASILMQLCENVIKQ